MKIIRSKKAMAAIGLATGLSVAAGAAFAFNWTSNATGNGNAKASSLAFHVNGSTPTADTNLFPGSTTGAAVTTSIHNDNPYQITITAAPQTPASSISATGGKSTCDASTATYTAGPTGTLTVAAGADAVVTLGTLKIDSTTGDGCQGATYSVPVTVTAVQSAVS